MPVNDLRPVVYLTFDDGPHPQITDWVLAQLEEYKAKATFFCVGKNVVEYPDVYHRVLAAGHAVGNHSYSHIKGRSTNTDKYLIDIKRAQQFIDSTLFRPPYGSIKSSQAKALQEIGFKIVLWRLIPGDWDAKVSPQDCLERIVFNLAPGDIIVLHDSEKAKVNMQYVLPRLLKYCNDQGWALDTIKLQDLDG